MQVQQLGRRMAAMGFTLVVGAMALAPGALASGATVVSGRQVLDTAGACPNAPGAMAAWVMTGSLTGCWYTDTVEMKHMTPSGAALASGTEHFSGCIGATCGTLFFTFTFTGKYAPDGSEVHGRCYHPISGGTDGFAGASGAISFHDESASCSNYHGEVRIAGN